MATIMARPAAEAIRRRAEEDGIEFFFAQFVDMHAKPSAKLVPMSNFDGLVSEGAGFAGFAAGPIGQTPASPDMMAIPDLRTYTKVPFKPGLARFACDIHVEGEEFPYCPRTILRRQLARAKELGFTFKIGMELEFFLLREKEDGGIELADPLDRLDQPCYDMKGLTRQYEFLSTLSKNVNELGWGSYANDHEDANGQFESNFEFADALETADRAIFFRYMVHAMAQERGLLATFMAKPFGHLTGNGGHFHMSLWDESGQRDLFDDPSDRNGLGLSTLGYHFLGGLKKHAKAYIAITAPTVNSYKRLTTATDRPTSGATWAPVYVSHGRNNRTQMLRCPAATSRTARWTGAATRTWRPRRSWRPASTGSSTTSIRGRRTTTTSTPSRRASSSGARSSSCRQTCSTPRGTSRRTRSSARPSGTPAPRTTSTTS